MNAAKVTEPSDLKDLTLLGSQAQPSKKLEAFPNRSPDRYYLVTLETDEFTCLCPKTGQPDFATIRVEYVPDQKVVESKSFKLYLWSYRNEGAFHEHVVNLILDDLVKLLEPHWCLVRGIFNIRGGIGITVEAEHTKTPAARQQWRIPSKQMPSTPPSDAPAHQPASPEEPGGGTHRLLA